MSSGRFSVIGIKTDEEIRLIIKGLIAAETRKIRKQKLIKINDSKN